MKEASGELNMTLITIVAIALIAGLFAALWPNIKKAITNKWDNTNTTMSNLNGNK
jgi:FtsZ-interacting cell division protein ZipA